MASRGEERVVHPLRDVTLYENGRLTFFAQHSLFCFLTLLCILSIMYSHVKEVWKSPGLGSSSRRILGSGRCRWSLLGQSS